MNRTTRIIGILLLWVPVALADSDWTPLHTAADEGDVAEATKLLKNQPTLVNSTDSGGHTPLHLAAFSGRAAMTKLLLANGAKINAPDGCGWTPLHTAAARGHKDVAELLVQNHA